MLQLLPNLLTASRILLVAPLGALILREQYGWALLVGAGAGLTDALDGFLARTLNARSRLGAVMDPIADKLLVSVVFVCLALQGLAPWSLALLVLGRDLVILAGAICYRWLIGPVDIAPLLLSKLNMGLQILYCSLVLLAAVTGRPPPVVIDFAAWAVAAMALVSGAAYVVLWSRKAWANRGDRKR